MAEPYLMVPRAAIPRYAISRTLRRTVPVRCALGSWRARVLPTVDVVPLRAGFRAEQHSLLSARPARLLTW
jgi:hypothetical protein